MEKSLNDSRKSRKMFYIAGNIQFTANKPSNLIRRNEIIGGSKMKKLIVPPKLNEGDTVAFISISGCRAGDEDMLPRYLLGK